MTTTGGVELKAGTYANASELADLLNALAKAREEMRSGTAVRNEAAVSELTCAIEKVAQLVQTLDWMKAGWVWPRDARGEKK